MKEELAHYRLDPKDFWGRAGGYMILIAIMGLFFLLAVSVIKRGTKKSLQRKEAVFAALAGQPIEKFAGDPELKQMAEGARWLLQQTKKGISFNESFQKYKLTSQLFFGLDQSGRERVEADLILRGGLPPSFIEMAAQGYWMDLFKNPWDYQVMTELLEEKRRDVPYWDTNYADLPGYWWFIWLAIVQFFGFFSFLCSVAWADYYWHQLPWKKGWTIFSLLILMPGALPLLVIATLGSLPSIVKRIQIGRGERAERLGGPSFSDQDIKGESSVEVLLNKLRQRVGKNHV